MDEIAAISRSVALEHGRALQVAGVTSTEGGSDRVEILVTLMGCHQDPCRIIVNVSRADRVVLESELRAVLRRAVSEHLSGGAAG